MLSHIIRVVIVYDESQSMLSHNLLRFQIRKKKYGKKFLKVW